MDDMVAINRLSDRDKLVIDWFIGKRCNFDCTYCGPETHDNFSKHIPLESLKSSIDVCLQKFPANKIKIGFTGGEPCVHPEFHLFAEYMHDKGLTFLTVTTNGSRTKEYYISLHKHIKNYTFSQHFEHADNNDFLPKIKAINDAMSDEKHLMVQVMYHSKYIDQVKEAVEFYKTHGISYSLRRIRTKGKGIRSYNDYTQEDIDWFDQATKTNNLQSTNVEVWLKQDNEISSQEFHVNQISGEQKNNFLNWTCYAGLEYIHIWHDGTAYRGNCHVGGPIGNITDDNFSLPTEPVVCDRTLCFCAPEITVKKYKNEKYKGLLDV